MAYVKDALNRDLSPDCTIDECFKTSVLRCTISRPNKRYSVTPFSFCRRRVCFVAVVSSLVTYTVRPGKRVLIASHVSGRQTLTAAVVEYAICFVLSPLLMEVVYKAPSWRAGLSCCSRAYRVRLAAIL